MVQCLHQSSVYFKKKLRVWTVQKCSPLVGVKTSLTCAGLQMTPSHVSVYSAENGNLRKSGSTFCHGTVVAPKQCLYQKESTRVESPKIYSACLCKNLIYLCGTANDPVSSRPVECQEGKFAEFWVYHVHCYLVCTKAMFISKGSYLYKESKNVFLSSVQKRHLPLRDCKRPHLK